MLYCFMCPATQCEQVALVKVKFKIYYKSKFFQYKNYTKYAIFTYFIHCCTKECSYEINNMQKCKCPLSKGV